MGPKETTAASEAGGDAAACGRYAATLCSALKIGQVWQDADKRCPWRKILIVGLDSCPTGYAEFRPCNSQGVPYRTDNKPRKARKVRFGRKANGYILPNTAIHRNTR